MVLDSLTNALAKWSSELCLITPGTDCHSEYMTMTLLFSFLGQVGQAEKWTQVNKELCYNLQRPGQPLELLFKTARLKTTSTTQLIFTANRPLTSFLWRKQEDDSDVWFFIHSFHGIFSLRKSTALPCVSTVNTNSSSILSIILTIYKTTQSSLYPDEQTDASLESEGKSREKTIRITWRACLKIAKSPSLTKVFGLVYVRN